MTTWSSHVKVPNSFFAKSKSEYRDWKWAFVRELIQNSYDAGATRIDFSLKVDSNGDTIVQCFDDGKGMDDRVLTEVLLCLGGSEKDAGAVGGFGYAKHILFFAHKRYSIWTKNWVVDGCGGNYNISTAKMPLPRGTDVTVVMDRESNMDEDFESTLRFYVANMSPDRQVAISFSKKIAGLKYDKEELKQGDKAYKYLVKSELGNLTFMETTNRLIRVVVSVHGLPMFEHQEVTLDKGVVGKLDLVGVSYEVLTTNREAFRGSSWSTYVGLIRSIVLDRSSIKRKAAHRILFNSVDQGKFKAPSSICDLQVENPEFPDNFVVSIPLEGATDVSDSVASTLVMFKKGWLGHFAHVWKAYVLSLGLTGYLVDGGHVKAEIDVGVPGSVDDIISYLEPGSKLRLLDSKGNLVVTGFILDPDLEGVNQVMDGIRLILINPNYYTERYWHQEVQDLAIHEMTHLIHSGHGEDFVDADMRIRRSFRKAVSEKSLRANLKEFLRNRC